MSGDERPPGTEEDEVTLRPPTAEQLAWLRRRLALNDRLLGYDLNRYQEIEGLSDDQLATFLGATVDQVNRLRLAGRPRAANYNADVREIAQSYGVSDFQLIRLLRSVQFDSAVAAAPIAGRLLAAARDHEGEPGESTTPAVAEERAEYTDSDHRAAERTDDPERGSADDPTGRDSSR